MIVQISSKLKKKKQKLFYVLFNCRFVTEEKVLEIEVEAGVSDGYEIPFLAEGLIFNSELFI